MIAIKSLKYMHIFKFLLNYYLLLYRRIFILRLLNKYILIYVKLLTFLIILHLIYFNNYHKKLHFNLTDINRLCCYYYETN